MGLYIVLLAEMIVALVRLTVRNFTCVSGHCLARDDWLISFNSESTAHLTVWSFQLFGAVTPGRLKKDKHIRVEKQQNKRLHMSPVISLTITKLERDQEWRTRRGACSLTFEYGRGYMLVCPRPTLRQNKYPILDLLFWSDLVIGIANSPNVCYFSNNFQALRT